MQKRVISLLLSVLTLFSLVSLAVPTAYAASDLTVSDACIEFIKGQEGFTAKPYYDYGQYSVGYGTACSASAYPNGITEEEAEQLLREYITDDEARLNAFADKYGITFKQHQFDALISFTYNLGSSWMYNDSTFRKAVISGAAGNDFIFAITRWCTAGEGDDKTVQLGLVKRRLMEANMYLNGVYSNAVPSNYEYVIFNNNIETCTNDVRIQGYDANTVDGIRATPTKSGYRFLGWYTGAKGGEWITVLGSKTSSISFLFAHWQEGDGPKDSAGKIVGTAASYTRTANTVGQIIRSTPSISGEVTGQLESNEEVTIVADYMDSNNVKWGKLSDGGWINLSTTAAEEETNQTAETKLEKPAAVSVLRSGVNIRSGPGTNYAKIGTATKGDVLTITAIQKGGQYLWGKFGTSWICLDYTDYNVVTSESSEDASVVTATGIVIGADQLNVRSGPGTNYSKVGTLNRGDAVKITLQQSVNGKMWGLTETGWVSLYYIELTPISADTAPDTTEPEETKPTETPDSSNQDNTATEQTKPANAVTGVVVNCGTLNVRSAAGTGNSRIGGLVVGTPVTIVAQTTAGGQVWGQLQQGGWVCMTYVELDSTVTGEAVATGTVYNCTALNVRAGAGTGYAKVGKLINGTKVEIFETKTVGNATWAHIAQGWVHMNYIRLNSAAQAPVEPDNSASDNTGSSDTTVDTDTSAGTATESTGIQTGVIYKTDVLNIRSAAGVKNEVVGTLTKGTQVTILEVKRYAGSNWGRIEQGWISLYYVDLIVTTDVEGAVVVTVCTDSLRIRSGAGTGYAQVGSYKRNTKIVVYEQTTGADGRPWGRTDKGWICMEYTK